MTWIPTKDELSRLILPSDTRYYMYGSLGGSFFKEERTHITDRVWLLLHSDILRVVPKEIPTRLPKQLPRAIVQSWLKNWDIPSERWGWWVEHLNQGMEWCHHDRERGHLMARLLCRKYRKWLLHGWKVVDAPSYSVGGKADLGLVSTKGELLVAVEVGDMSLWKLAEPFSDAKFRQLWHWPYYGWPDQRKYEWERDEIYWVWTRGRRWGEPPLSVG